MELESEEVLEDISFGMLNSSILAVFLYIPRIDIVTDTDPTEGVSSGHVADKLGSDPDHLTVTQ